MGYQVCSLEMVYHGFPGDYSWVARGSGTYHYRGEKFRLGLNWSSDAQSGALENRHYDAALSALLSDGWEPLSSDSSGKITKLKRAT